jgi:hypothetical protein
VASPPNRHPGPGTYDGHPHTWRVNTGTVAFVPFTANSLEEACEYVRRHQNRHYAAARWLQILEDGAYVWVT